MDTLDTLCAVGRHGGAMLTSVLLPVRQAFGSTPINLTRTAAGTLRGKANLPLFYLSTTTNDARHMSSEARPPFPPYNFETAREKVRLAEAAWNTRDPAKVALAYTPDSKWRNRSEFLQGREEIKAFLTRKWEKELDYCLMKELWGFHNNRISARFEYEYRNAEGQWFRAHGNEQWEFDEKGLMARRDASINDVPIKESERKYHRDPKTGLVTFRGHPGFPPHPQEEGRASSSST